MRFKLIILSYLIILLFTQVVQAQSEKFVEELLKYKCDRNSYFVVVNIEHERIKKNVVVQSGALCDTLVELKESNKSTFKDLLVKKKNLKLDGYSVLEDPFFVDVYGLSSDRFRKVYKNESINKIASTGCIKFISHFFLEKQVDTKKIKLSCNDFIKKTQEQNELMLRKSLTFIEKTALIEKLFAWQILVRFDDVKGTLVLDYY